MIPTIAVLSVWLLFGGSHLLLSWPPVRDSLSERIGASNFIVVYSIMAAISLCLLGWTVAWYGSDGPGGFNLAEVPLAKWTLGVVAVLGALLMAAGLANYPKSPMSELSRRMRASIEKRRQPLHPPTVIEKVTRHPFFVGLALLMAAHALLASTLPATVYYSGFALLALVGIPMQDRKLLQRHGDVYGSHLKATAAIPFAAVRRPTKHSLKMYWPVLAMSIAAVVMLVLLHPLLSLQNGAWFAIIVAVGGLIRVFKTLREAKKH